MRWQQQPRDAETPRCDGDGEHATNRVDPTVERELSEDKGVFEAFGRSRELVRGHGWQVFGAIVLAFLIVFAVGIVAGIIGASIGDAGQVILGAIANVITAPVLALVASILFFDLGGGTVVAAAPEAPEVPAV